MAPEKQIPDQSCKSPRRAHVVRRLVKSQQLIENHYDEPLTLADLAAEACMSDAHFVRQYGAEFGITPYRYLTDCRLEAARQLLLETRMAIADIVVSTGFGNRSAFSRLFKSRYGLSPQHFRQENRVRGVRPIQRMGIGVGATA